jgi:hypothetical protein
MTDGSSRAASAICSNYTANVRYVTPFVAQVLEAVLEARIHMQSYRGQPFFTLPITDAKHRVQAAAKVNPNHCTVGRFLLQHEPTGVYRGLCVNPT